MPFPELNTFEIVLADDDVDEQYFFELAVKKLPFVTKLNILPDGVLLLQYLLQPGIKSPDIIFLDIMMPRKDGIECLMEIKCNENLKEIPIVMYSNSVSQEYIMKSYENGALYFLPKGNYSELTASIQKLLNIANKKDKQGSIEDFKFSLYG